MFKALKSYYNSQASCLTLMKKCFEDPAYQLYLKFVLCHLVYFNQIILTLKKENTAIDVANILSEVKQNLQEKKKSVFIPSQLIT